jgi:hypothetical protein
MQGVRLRGDVLGGPWATALWLYRLDKPLGHARVFGGIYEGCSGRSVNGEC